MQLRELMEKRAAIVGQMRTLNSAPAGNGGDLSDDQQSEFEALEAELRSADRAIQRTQLLEEADRRAEGVPLNPGSDDFEVAKRSFSLCKAIAAEFDQSIDAGREREVSQELQRRSDKKFRGVAVPMEVFQRPAGQIEQRALTSTLPADGPGSNIIPTDHRGDLFIDILRSQMVTQQLGATVLSGLTGDVDIPRLKASAAAGWVAENAAITASDHQFDKVQMTPKHVGVLTEFSRNMLLQSSPDIEQLVRQDFAAVLARELDKAALVGGGTDEPDGLLAADTGINTTVSMATPTWGDVLDLINTVEEADSVGTGFAMRPLAATKLRKTVRVASTDSRFIMDTPDQLANYPAVRSTQIPIVSDATSVIFGRWSDLLIGYWSAVDVLVNPYESTAYSKGNVAVRGMLTADVAVRHPESFAAAIDFPAA